MDKRTDIWAFGCVLYELLTGKQTFAGETITDILGAIVHKEPDWELLPERTPWSIRRLLRRCLEKDSSDRLRDIGDARIEIEETLERPELESQTSPILAPRARWQQLLPWALVGVLSAIILTWALIDSGEVPEEMGSVRFPIFPPETVSFLGVPSVSPDGKKVGFLWSRRH